MINSRSQQLVSFRQRKIVEWQKIYLNEFAGAFFFCFWNRFILKIKSEWIGVFESKNFKEIFITGTVLFHLLTSSPHLPTANFDWKRLFFFHRMRAFWKILSLNFLKSSNSSCHWCAIRSLINRALFMPFFAIFSCFSCLRFLKRKCMHVWKFWSFFRGNIFHFLLFKWIAFFHYLRSWCSKDFIF